MRDEVPERTLSPDGRTLTEPGRTLSGSEIVAGIIAAAEGTDGPTVAAEPGVVGKLIESGAVTLGPAEPMPAQGKVPAGFGGVNHKGHQLARHHHEWEAAAAKAGTRASLAVTCTGRWWCETCSEWFDAPRCAKHTDQLPALVTA